MSVLIPPLWAIFRILVSLGCLVAFIYQTLLVGDYGYAAFWGVCSIMWTPKDRSA